MASGKKVSGFLGGGKGDGERAGLDGAVVEFGEFANRGADAATNRNGPERAQAAHGEFFLRGLIQELLNVGV